MRTSLQTLVLASVCALALALVQPLTSNASKASSGLVDVDFFVMSKCPDAAACEKNFEQGIAAVSSLINLRVSYIANETAPGEFVCRHGPTECAGDQQQLCVQHYSDPAREAARALAGQAPTWFEFAVCQSASQSAIPSNGQACASQLDLDWSLIQSCLTSGLSQKLLHESIGRVVRGTNDTISCTINLDEQFWCQHNGDWAGCEEGTTNEAFIASVCERYQGAKPDVCTNAARRPAIVFERR